MTERNEEGGGLIYIVGTPSPKAVIFESTSLSEMRIVVEPGSWNRLEILFKVLIVFVGILDFVDNEEASNFLSRNMS